MIGIGISVSRALMFKGATGSGPSVGDGLLLETGDFALLETGDFLLLE